MDTYVFNEQKKCLEPIVNECMCCGRSFSHGEKVISYIPLYKDKGYLTVNPFPNLKKLVQTELDVESCVDYKKIQELKIINVEVVMCADCKKLQRGIKVQSIIIGILSGIAIATAMISIKVFAVGFIASIGVGSLVSWQWNKKKCLKHGILSKKDAAMKYDIVNALLNDGWTFENPNVPTN